MSAVSNRVQEIIAAAAEEQAAGERSNNDDREGEEDTAGDNVEDEDGSQGSDEEPADDDNDDDDAGQQQQQQHPDLLDEEDRPILGHHDPGRMDISPLERRNALAIKEAAANDPDLDPISDFMCAQLALLEGDNIEAALERAHGLQMFRQEYDIQETLDDGVRCFTGLIDLFPRFHLCFTYSAEQGNYVFIYDMAQFDLRLLTNDKRIRYWLGGTYYCLTVISPDLEAVRRGAILMNECQGCVYASIEGRWV